MTSNLTVLMAPKRLLAALVIALSLLVAGGDLLYAAGNRTYQCNTSEDVHKALEAVGPGDTIMLQGGRVYEIDESFLLRANGTESDRIYFTSKDDTGQDRDCRQHRSHIDADVRHVRRLLLPEPVELSHAGGAQPGRDGGAARHGVLR